MPKKSKQTGKASKKSSASASILPKVVNVFDISTEQELKAFMKADPENIKLLLPGDNDSLPMHVYLFGGNIDLAMAAFDFMAEHLKEQPEDILNILVHRKFLNKNLLQIAREKFDQKNLSNHEDWAKCLFTLLDNADKLKAFCHPQNKSVKEQSNETVKKSSGDVSLRAIEKVNEITRSFSSEDFCVYLAFKKHMKEREKVFVADGAAEKALREAKHNKVGLDTVNAKIDSAVDAALVEGAIIDTVVNNAVAAVDPDLNLNPVDPSKPLGAELALPKSTLVFPKEKTFEEIGQALDGLDSNAPAAFALLKNLLITHNDSLMLFTALAESHPAYLKQAERPSGRTLLHVAMNLGKAAELDVILMALVNSFTSYKDLACFVNSAGEVGLTEKGKELAPVLDSKMQQAKEYMSDTWCSLHSSPAKVEQTTAGQNAVEPIGSKEEQQPASCSA